LKLVTEPAEVRLAHAEDAESIAACLQLAFEPFRSQYTDDAFRDTVTSPEGIRQRIASMKVYVAVANDGTVIGTVAAAVSSGEAHLRGMAVRPDWQGHGIAEQLLTKVENDLLTVGCARITLDSTLPLQRAMRFYEKNGFTPSGNITDFFGMPLYEYVKRVN
jgi:GNAT superfamily N-acetyltransferase